MRSTQHTSCIKYYFPVLWLQAVGILSKSHDDHDNFDRHHCPLGVTITSFLKTLLFKVLSLYA